MTPDPAPWPVATALELLDEEGFEAVTVRAVAARAGYTPMAVYRHVDDLDDLLRRVVRRVFEDWESSVYPVVETADPLARLRRYARLYREHAVAHPHRYEVLFVLRHGIGTHRFPDGFRETPASTFRILTDTIREAMECGVLAEEDPVEVALLFWSAAHGLVMLERSGRFGDPDRFAAVYERSVRRLLRSLGAPPRDGTEGRVGSGAGSSSLREEGRESGAPSPGEAG